MSTINTNGINTNYPVPGVNNNSQGFRDNFASIKNNLDIAGTEITDLQNKVVLKSALANSTLNNDMANTLISNASTRSFRATMFNLGSALTGPVKINASLGDVQFGGVSGNIVLQFGNWSPTGTQQSLELQFAINDPTAIITFPSEAIFSNDDYGVTLVQNNSDNGVGATVTAPYDCTQLNFKITTVDCGNTLYVQPVNRGFQATQIKTRTPPPTGQQGDTSGTVCVDASVNQLTITGTTAATDVLTTSGNTAQLYKAMPVVFTGTSLDANITIGNTYYVRNVVSATTFTISSSSALSANIDVGTSTGNMYMNPMTYLYVAAGDYSATAYEIECSDISSNAITVTAGFANIANNAPVIFTGGDLPYGGLETNVVYYVKAATPGSPNTITVSRTRDNGIAGPVEILTDNTGNLSEGACYVGNDIWRRIPLNPW